MPNTIDSQDPLTAKEQSIANVLIRGSGTSPIPINSLKHHLQKVDSHAWQIIWDEFMRGSREDIHRILTRVIHTPEIQFSKKALVDMILVLPRGIDLKEKLSVE